jgi:uncharacterized protein (DUF952 family)
VIYKLLMTAEWRAAEAAGELRGSAADLADGYLHLSAADQVVETARLYFAGVSDLTLLAVDPDVLGDAVRWEQSRGGALFPHLYAPLPVDAVRAALALDGALPVEEAVAAAIAGPRTG